MVFKHQFRKASCCLTPFRPPSDLSSLVAVTQMACLTMLPMEVIEEIALVVASLHPYQSPATLLSLLLLNRRLHSSLRPSSNPSLYAKLFKARFDVSALQRRFFNTLSPQADPKSLAIKLCDAYIERLLLFKRMRRYAAIPRNSGEHDLESDLGPYHQAPTFAQPNREPMSLLTRDLWLVYLMVMENDGKNSIELVKSGEVVQFMKNFHLNKLLGLAVRPGYPPASPETAIGMRLYYLFVDLKDERLESNTHVEELRETNFFVLKPYVFGSHVFEASYAPWNWRHFPHPSPSTSTTAVLELSTSSQSPPHQPDHSSLDASERSQTAHPPELRPPQLAEPSTLHYMGQCLQILPPLNSHVALVAFFWNITCMNSLNRTSSQPSSSAEEMFTQKMTKILTIPSTSYDLDYKRSTSCLDPHVSPGLSFDTFKGAFEGVWEGKFSFFDYTSYREMLMGRLQSIYEGRYGDQPQMFKLREVIVRTRDNQCVRFKAGTRTNQTSSLKRGRPSGDEESEDEIEHLLRMPIPDISALEEIEYDPTENYEVQLHGTGHSAWGGCLLKGRIRAWDGLMTLLKNYRSDATVSGAAEPLRNACWLYRGYAAPDGALIGRWRDTYTPPHMPGYEGAFIMFPR